MTESLVSKEEVEIFVKKLIEQELASYGFSKPRSVTTADVFTSDDLFTFNNQERTTHN